jgi:predicted metal-dependent phosphoesterase TrpH
MKVKVCLHNHTLHSKSSINRVDDFRKAFEAGKIDKVAITDHDYIKYAQEMQAELGEDRIIVGQEITTKEGDILGLFLKKFVSPGLSAERTCELIKAQGGVVYAPHILGEKGLKREVLDRIKDDIDVVEVYNGWRHRSIAKPFMSEKFNDRAKNWAHENGKAGVSATDCHYPTNIGNCHTIMKDFSDRDSFLKSLNSDVELVKRKNKKNLLSVRTWVKSRLKRDFLSFIRG